MIEMYTCTRTIKINRGVGTVPTVPMSPLRETGGGIGILRHLKGSVMQL
jgi:hypothetical protein